MKAPFLILIALGLGGCAENLSVMHEKKINLESDATLIGSGALPIVRNADGTLCFGPQPDSSINVDVSGGLTSQMGSALNLKDDDNEASLGGRNPNVLITRDLLFQSCLAETRLKLSAKQRKELFEKTLGVIQAINSQSLEGSAIENDQATPSD
ncbi:hypothetical protein N9B69_01585 [Amylibacter sp.]|nr:hypothetical protein [Amylibacter sp.]